MTTHTARLRAPADFGLALQQARLARGLTQSQVAAELDVPQGAVSAIESGQTTIFLRRLLEPARTTGVECSASWNDDDAPRG